jgi:putative ABC transport system ATP-binding protein
MLFIDFSMIKTEGLYKVFNSNEVETIALNSVNFEIDQGEFVAVMGPSGCGKSTLLNILGLLDNPTDGKIWFFDKEVSRFNENDRTDLRRGNIGFIFQSFNLIDELNVYENIELPLLYLRIHASERRNRVVQVMEQLKISHRREFYPQQLSGGQQQKVAIARAIVTMPKLILADEPTGNLDSKTSIEILGVLEEIHKNGNTVIIVTHEEDIALHAHRIIRLMDGKISVDEQNKNVKTIADYHLNLDVN